MDVLDIGFRVGGLVLSLAALAWALLAYLLGARKAAMDKMSTRIDACEAKMAADAHDGHTSRAKVAERLTAVELSFREVPNKESVHKLALDVSEIRGDMKGMGESLKAVAATSRRVEEFLLHAATVTK